MNNDTIFNLIKTHKFKTLYKLIKDNEISSFDIKDSNYNYFIHFIINYNKIKLMKLIFKKANEKNINLRFDQLDIDGRIILYNCIKYNYIEMMSIILKNNNINIGFNIYDIKDRLGLTLLHYTIIFNNLETLKLLLEYNADLYIKSNEGHNIFVLSIIYNRQEIFNYLMNIENNLTFLNNDGESLLQIAVKYNNLFIIKMLLERIDLNIISSDYGQTVLHQSIILNNFELFKKLLQKKIDYNLADFYGNTSLHYILIENRIDYLSLFIELNDINFNISNINGDIPLHLLLNSNININELNPNILNKFILNSDLNIQNNTGLTCLIKLISENLHMKYRYILITKPLIFFIENKESVNITNDILDILIESYYNQIMQNKKDLIVDWHKLCSTNSFEELKKILKKTNGYNSEMLCKEKIKEVILKEKKSIPKLSNIDIKFDNGIIVNRCYYTGSPIDILFGLKLLSTDFKNKKLNVILDYPLTINTKLKEYYEKIGINYPYNLDFSNIEILWCYQKIFYPSFFDTEIIKKVKISDFIVIPIGIQTSVGAHANILFWDIKNNTIERFEPNGSNYPMGLNYNPALLDNILEQKFISFHNDIKYYSPSKFLSPISFQILENIETSKCKKIGDPNGFCGVWCIWWVYQRMLNIDNSKLNINNIAQELIKILKFDNNNFKTLIRNFSKKITDKRDKYLIHFKIDINDWILGNYNEDILNKLEDYIIKTF